MVDERLFKRKIWIVVALCLLIVAGLLYLILSGGTDKLKHKSNQDPKPTPTVTPADPENEHTPEPVITPDTTPTPSTEPSPTPESSSEPEVTPEPTPETTPEPTPEVSPEPDVPDARDDDFMKSLDIRSDTSIYRIVNKKNTISSSYRPADLVSPSVFQNNKQYVRKEAAGAIEKMFDAAKKDGITLYLISGYRSYQEQSSLWETYKARYGTAEASRIDAYPGTSEHQLGLSVDIGEKDQRCELKACFAQSAAFKWLHEHAWEYGFVERNPEGSEKITGIMFSPWNYRYFGEKEAAAIHKSGLTLEEYYKSELKS